MARDAAPVREGDVLAQKYRVERVLGRGGMGVVVAATHMQLRERVALKFLLSSAASDPQTVERFLREAQAAVRVKSEHVARIIDVGTLDTGAPYMVMEYLDGIDLSRYLRERRRLPIPEAVDYVLQACEAIAEAHALGIVHRDIKPANLFLAQRNAGPPIIKVLDFGISKTIQTDGAGQVDLTATAAILGSPKYMSPEQVRSSKRVDGRADVWSLGVVLHELVAGAAPFHEDTLAGLLAAIIADPPARLRDMCPDAPAGLESVILGCLEKDVARRVPDVAALANLLAPFAPPRARLFSGSYSGVPAAAAPAVFSASVPSGAPVVAGPTGFDGQPYPAPTHTTTAQPVASSKAPTAASSATTAPSKRLAAAVASAAAIAFVAVVSVTIVVLRARLQHEPARLEQGASIHPNAAAATSGGPAGATPYSTVATPAASSDIPAAPRVDAPAAPSPVAVGDAAASAAHAPLAAPRKVAPGARAAAPVVPPATSAPPPGKPAPAANCAPPYYFDESGNKVFKKECF